MASVAPEFRPTLRDELARVRPPLRRAAVVGLVALVVVLALVAFIATRPKGVHVVAHRPVTWNLYHPQALRQTRAPAGELLHLQHRGAHGKLISLFVVEPLRLPAYKGNPGGVLPVLADAAARGAAPADPRAGPARGGQGARQHRVRLPDPVPARRPGCGAGWSCSSRRVTSGAACAC